MPESYFKWNIVISKKILSIINKLDSIKILETKLSVWCNPKIILPFLYVYVTFAYTVLLL